MELIIGNMLQADQMKINFLSDELLKEGLNPSHGK